MILNRRIPANLRPVLLSPGAGVDSYGDPVESWAAPVESPLPRGSYVEEGPGDESLTALKDAVRYDATLYVPGDFPALTEKSRIRYRGDTFRVDGPPRSRWRHSGAASFTVAALTRWEGA